MTSARAGRGALWLCAGAIALTAALLFAGTIREAARIDLSGLEHPFAPGRWDGRTAFARCAPALDGRVAWPAEPARLCGVLHMCAAEAALDARQRAELLATVRRTPGCQEP
jgi:hypothetical protein